jgi:hypothetical protein
LPPGRRRQLDLKPQHKCVSRRLPTPVGFGAYLGVPQLGARLRVKRIVNIALLSRTNDGRGALAGLASNFVRTGTEIEVGAEPSLSGT